jgi:hypothetical protein
MAGCEIMEAPVNGIAVDIMVAMIDHERLTRARESEETKENERWSEGKDSWSRQAKTLGRFHLWRIFHYMASARF